MQKALRHQDTEKDAKRLFQNILWGESSVFCESEVGENALGFSVTVLQAVVLWAFAHISTFYRIRYICSYGQLCWHLGPP